MRPRVIFSALGAALAVFILAWLAFSRTEQRSEQVELELAKATPELPKSGAKNMSRVPTMLSRHGEILPTATVALLTADIYEPHIVRYLNRLPAIVTTDPRALGVVSNYMRLQFVPWSTNHEDHAAIEKVQALEKERWNDQGGDSREEIIQRRLKAAELRLARDKAESATKLLESWQSKKYQAITNIWATLSDAQWREYAPYHRADNSDMEKGLKEWGVSEANAREAVLLLGRLAFDKRPLVTGEDKLRSLIGADEVYAEFKPHFEVYVTDGFDMKR